MKTLLNKPDFANHNQKELIKNNAIITAAILRFSETGLINGKVIKDFEKISGE